MTTSHNPYTRMLVTFHPERFYGRSVQITNILGVITAPEPTGHAIYGLRTTGKTTLMRFIKDPRGAMHYYSDYVAAPYRPGGGSYLVFVYVNFHNFGRNDGSIFHLMLDELVDEVHDDDRFDLDLDLMTSDPNTDRMQAYKDLKSTLNMLSEDYNIRVAFLFDDFDVPLHSNLVDGDDDRLLRALTERAALIIGTEDPISHIRPDFDKDSPLLGILRPEAIELLKDNEARALVTGIAADAELVYTAEEINFLLATGGRQPFTLITACELYFNMRLDFHDISEMLTNKADAKRLRAQFLPRLAALPHVETILQMLWDKIDYRERQTLLQTANGAKVSTLGGRHASIAAQLANKGLMYQDIRHGVYRIFSDVFAYFVSQITEEAPQHITYNTDHAIKTVPLPTRQTLDKLSPIDRRLFRYFMEHADRICTFEELLDAVWDDEPENKRPLEASVYRLRRDLKGFGQIRNVRGKGYMFVSGNKDKVHS